MGKRSEEFDTEYFGPLTYCDVLLEDHALTRDEYENLVAVLQRNICDTPK